MVIKRRPTIDLVVPSDGEAFFRKGAKLHSGSFRSLLTALILTLAATALLIWPPFDVAMNERLRMRPGLPPYDWWADPPDSILMKAHVFNYTNVEAFLNGTDDFLRVQDVGPLIYKEKMTHHDIRRNDNDTISYVATHNVIYMPEMNTIDMNASITVPNYAALGVLSFLKRAPFFIKMGLNMMIRKLKTQPFRTMSIHDYLWNFTDPILSASHNLVPTLAPFTNAGMLSRVYDHFQDNVTMFIGTQHGVERFSLIDKYDGTDELPNYKNCKDRLTNATEGVTYGQFMTRESVPKYWRKTVCKAIEIYYEKDLIYMGMQAYKYVKPPWTYNRTEPSVDDCYRGSPLLPNGLSDVSNCYNNVPIVASFPHMMYADAMATAKLRGLAPDADLHMSFLTAEPVTGVPLQSIARSQSNMAVARYEGFTDDFQKLSGYYLPMFWLEYNSTGLPTTIHVALYILTVILPPLQILLVILLMLGAIFYSLRFAISVLEAQSKRRALIMRQMSHRKDAQEFLDNNNEDAVVAMDT